MSPYEFDLDWGEINEPDEMASVVQNLGRATAKVHCASDEDSDQDLVDFQTEEAIVAVVEGRRREFVADLTDFAIDYAEKVRAATTRCSSTRSARAGSAASAPRSRTAAQRSRRAPGSAAR